MQVGTPTTPRGPSLSLTITIIYGRYTNIDFKDFDLGLKQLPNGVYLPKPEAVFSINVEPEFITMDNNDRYAYLTLQENNAIAVFDILKLEIVSIFALGTHDFGFSGLDASDIDQAIDIRKYANLYGLRQSDGITYFRNKISNKQYVLTANEGNPKIFDTLRVNAVQLNSVAFPNGDILKDDMHLGRLKVLTNGGEQYGENEDGTFSALYTFGTRDFIIFEIETDDDDGGDCACEFPHGMRLALSSYDDFEQITAAFGEANSFNSDFYNPSFDSRRFVYSMFSETVFMICMTVMTKGPNRNQSRLESVAMAIRMCL